jgi:hypothetical protein
LHGILALVPPICIDFFTICSSTWRRQNIPLGTSSYLDPAFSPVHLTSVYFFNIAIHVPGLAIIIGLYCLWREPLLWIQLRLWQLDTIMVQYLT